MSSIWLVVAFALGFVVTFQIAKASEYVAILRGEDKTRKESNRINAFMLLMFLIVGLFGVWYCNERLKDKILPESASNHGERIDTMIWITLGITFFVFLITQILLFWFAFKYQERENQKAYYFPHDNRLEVIWTVIPAIVLTVLVGFGLYYSYLFSYLEKKVKLSIDKQVVKRMVSKLTSVDFPKTPKPQNPVSIK